MPALKVLGRRWHIAADDLPLPSFMGAIWHVAVIIPTCVNLAFVFNQLDTSCPYRQRHVGFLLLQLLCFIFNGVLHMWIFFESTRGSLFQVHRRRRVGPLTLALVIFYCLTCGSNIFGTRLVYNFKWESQCKAQPGWLDLNHYALLEAIVVATWVCIFTACLAVIISLNLFSTYKASSSPWLSRFKLYRTVCCCCFWVSCRGQGNGESGRAKRRGGLDSTDRTMSPMVAMANAFTHMFGRVDMTLTDYMAAFTLLGMRHSRSKPAIHYDNALPPAWLSLASLVPNLVTGSVDSSSANNLASGHRDGVVAPERLTEIEIMVCGRCKTHTISDTVAGSNEDIVAVMDAAPAAAAAAGVAETVAENVTLQVDSSLSSPAPNNTTKITMNVTSGIAASAPGAMSSSDRAIWPQAAGTGDNAPLSLSGAASHQPAACPSPTPGAATRWLGECVECSGKQDSQQQHGGVSKRRGPNADKEVLEEALHYMRFATAVYGWKMFLWMNRTRVTGCCQLCVGRGCGCCRQSSYFIRAVGPDYGPSEGCCSAMKLLEREAITQLTAVRDDDILYVCYDNQVGGLLPYYVAIDRLWRSIVVAVRGSMSLSDVTTDLLCEPAEYDVSGVPSTDDSGQRVMWAHRGILESTRAILRDLQQQGVLEAATANWTQGDEEAQQRLLQRLPSERARALAQRLRGAATGFRVVLTGHSLGAGVAGLLGPLLQQQFSNLRCWAFSPPGGLMSPKAAELTHSMCISLLYAKDMIPRLGVSTAEKLVRELVDVGVHSRVNKATIMGRMVLLGERPPLDQLLLPTGTMLKAELLAVLDKLKRFPQDRTDAQQQQQQQSRGQQLQGPQEAVSPVLPSHLKVEEQFAGARDFVPPGHMLYVERHKREAPPPGPSWSCSCNVCMLDRSSANVGYVCRWIQVKDLMQTGLVISRSMFLDHLPDNTLHGMQLALEQMVNNTLD